MDPMDALSDLESAEDFLVHFDVPHDAAVVHVNRLHILQRFHDYLAAADLPEDDEAWFAACQALMARAYDDFVHSDAVTEGVFKVFQDARKKQSGLPVLGGCSSCGSEGASASSQGCSH